MILKFKAKLNKVGNSHMVTIPKAYINNGMIDLERTYQFSVNTNNKEADCSGAH